MTGAAWAWYSFHSPGSVRGNLMARTVPILVPANSILPERERTTCVRTTSLALNWRRIYAYMDMPPLLCNNIEKPMTIHTVCSFVSLNIHTHVYTYIVHKVIVLSWVNLTFSFILWHMYNEQVTTIPLVWGLNPRTSCFWVHAYVHIYTHTCICTWTCVHTYTHTHMQVL